MRRGAASPPGGAVAWTVEAHPSTRIVTAIAASGDAVHTGGTSNDLVALDPASGAEQSRVTMTSTIDALDRTPGAYLTSGAGD